MDLEVGRINCLNVTERLSEGYYLLADDTPEKPISSTLSPSAWPSSGPYARSAPASKPKVESVTPQKVFLPQEAASKEYEIGDKVEVFVYINNLDQLIGSCKPPPIQVGQCALLPVKSVGSFGAFLDWGLPKDLLLPHSEQSQDVELGASVVVYLFHDAYSRRLTATTKLHRFLEESSGPFKIGDAVELLIASKTDIGYKAIINDTYLGLLYSSETSQKLSIGQTTKGWIKGVRDDGKVDLSVNRLDDETRDQLTEAIMAKLQKHGGRLNLSDKSPAEEIYKQFQVSKKNYKRALGGLYKRRKITIHKDYIQCLSDQGTCE